MTLEKRPVKRESMDVQVKKKGKRGAQGLRDSIRLRMALKEMDRDLYGGKTNA